MDQSTTQLLHKITLPAYFQLEQYKANNEGDASLYITVQRYMQFM